MVKNCLGCPGFYNDCWEKGCDYCERDQESLIPEKNEVCLGFSEINQDGTEYDCDYEFSGEIDCGSCLFNDNLPLECRKSDPRIDPHAEEEE